VARKKDAFFGPKIPATEAILKRDAAAIRSTWPSKVAKEIEGRVIADSPEAGSRSCSARRSGAPKVAEFRSVAIRVPSEVLFEQLCRVAYGTVYSERGSASFSTPSVRRSMTRAVYSVAFPTSRRKGEGS